MAGEELFIFHLRASFLQTWRDHKPSSNICSSVLLTQKHIRDTKHNTLIPSSADEHVKAKKHKRLRGIRHFGLSGSLRSIWPSYLCHLVFYLYPLGSKIRPFLCASGSHTFLQLLKVLTAQQLWRLGASCKSRMRNLEPKPRDASSSFRALMESPRWATRAWNLRPLLVTKLGWEGILAD